MVATLSGCVAGTVATVAWALPEWFSELSRTKATVALGTALETIEVGAFHGFVAALMASVLISASRRPPLPRAEPHRLVGRPWWITPAVGLVWAFTLGSDEFAAWTNRQEEHSNLTDTSDILGRPTPQSVLLGFLKWPVYLPSSSVTVIVLLLFLLPGGALLEGRLLRRSAGDPVPAFFFRWSAVSLFSALIIVGYATANVAMSEPVRPGTSLMGKLETAVRLLPRAFTESLEQALVHGPVVFAIPSLGIALTAHAVHLLSAPWAPKSTRALSVKLGAVITAAVFVPLGVVQSPTQPPAVYTMDIEGCLTPEPTCDRVMHGDVDGDGELDKVELTFHAPVLTAHVSTAAGVEHRQAVLEVERGLVPRWLGFADANGDRHGEIFVALQAGTRNIAAVALELRNNRLVPLRGIPDGRLLMSSLPQVLAGFTCSRTPDGPRFTTWVVRLTTTTEKPGYKGSEVTWAPLPDGTLRRSSTRRVQFPADTTNWGDPVPMAAGKKFGAHCPGLGY